MTDEQPVPVPEAKPDEAGIVAAVGRLTEAVNGLRADVTRLRRYGRRNRKLVLVDIIATLIAVISTVIALHANSDATRAQDSANRAYARVVAEHASQLSGCRIGNQLRAEQRELWSHLAAISRPPPHLTAAQLAEHQKQIRNLLAYVNHVFPQLDCKALYRLK